MAERRLMRNARLSVGVARSPMLVTYYDTGMLGGETSGIHTIVCRAGAGWHYRSAPRDFSQCLSTYLTSVDNLAGDDTQRFTGRNRGEAADPAAALRRATLAQGRDGLDERRPAWSHDRTAYRCGLFESHPVLVCLRQ